MKQVEIEVKNEIIGDDIYSTLYEISPAGFIERNDSGTHRFIIFVEDDKVNHISEMLSGYPWVAEIRIDKNVEEEGWLSTWKENYHPITIPPFKIIPIWQREDVDTEGYLPIYINSGIAFGTGEHETTRLCLRLLSKLDVKGKKVLDIGTGSGILAMAAAKLGASHVDAFDLDPVAVETARENIALNGIENIYVFQKDALAYRGEGATRYDVVLANLVWSILSEIPDGIKDVIVPDGIVIASGILKEQLNDFLTLYEDKGFIPLHVLEEEEWVGVMLRG